MGGMLFEPFAIRGLTLRNRIVRSATAERMADERGVPDDRLGNLYGDLAAGEVGLLVTGHLYVRADGCAHPEMVAIDRDEMIAPLAELVRRAHAGGALIAAQINHGGGACDPQMVAHPPAPSQIPAATRVGATHPRALEKEEIPALVEAFGAAAARAASAGFDAVQIHAAHGYLISQFLSPLSNRRDDRYGGSLANRARFLQEVAGAVRAAVGATFPVLIKLGATDQEEGGLELSEGAELAGCLTDFGIDAIEVSAGRRGAVRMRIDRPEREAYLLPLAEAVRARTQLPVIAVGGMRSRAVMEQVLARGIDLIALCRPLIREPDLARKLRIGASEGAACISCGRCWARELGEGTACRARRS